MGPQIPRGAPPLSGFRAGKAGESQPPLLLRLREALALRHYSASTVDAYAAWVRRFIIFHDRRHPAQMGAAEVTAFLSSLATEKSVSASTQNQALAALLFLYSEVLHQKLGAINEIVHAKGPRRLPVVMTRSEVARVLNELCCSAACTRRCRQRALRSPSVVTRLGIPSRHICSKRGTTFGRFRSCWVIAIFVRR